MQLFSEPLSDPLILAAPASYSLPGLQTALADGYGLAGTLDPLGGERDRNFRLRANGGTIYLVKLAHPAEDPLITDFQTRALLHLEAADPALPIPHLIRTRQGEPSLLHECDGDQPSQLRVLSFVPGEPITCITPAAGQYHRLGALVARLDRALEAFTHPADTRRLVWDIRESDCVERLLTMVSEPEQHALVSAALARFRAEAGAVLANLPDQVIHNDLNPHNILINPAQPDQLTGLIDFGDMLRATRVQEVATACAYLLQPGADPLAGVAAFIGGYTTLVPLSDAELQLLPVLMAMRMAITVVITNWRARLQPENAGYICRNVPSALTGLRSLAGLSQATALHALRSQKSTPSNV
jgi:Ser/Thr protein kinase RdoA (MazF antagonist)